MIAIFNYLLFIFSYWILINTFKVDRLNLLLLFLATPMLLVSILTLNKEILGFFVVSMFTCAIQKNKNRFLIFLILFFSIFVRWQLFFTMFLFLIFQKFSSGYIRRIVILASIIMIISLVYPIFHNFFDVQSILNLDINISEQTTKSGFIILLNDLQNIYMFFLAVIPKIMYNLFADANKIYFSITELNTLDYTDIYNKIRKDELDLSILNRFLNVLRNIEDGELDQHEGAFVVGTLLKELYVDSALNIITCKRWCSLFTFGDFYLSGKDRP